MSDLNVSFQTMSDWFKLCCLCSILAISWEMPILSFIEIVWYFLMKESAARWKFVSDFLALFLFFDIIIEIVSNQKKVVCILKYFIETFVFKFCV